tara:strand:- start:268 stop:696 length:429 start_codon:yes stop_codon:yes gene_type:complete
VSKKRSNRGGYRQPANPAPVATPNRNRTDGGPGNKKQPLRRLPDAAYGENKAFMSGQRAVDGLPKVEPIPVPGQQLSQTLYGPSEKQYQKATSGNIIDINNDGIADETLQNDVDLLLEEMSARNPGNVLLTQLISTRQSQRF